MTPQVIEVTGVRKYNAEQKLKEAVPAKMGRMNELAYLAYEAVQRGKFGVGPFNIAITCDSTECVISIKKEDIA